MDGIILELVLQICAAMVGTVAFSRSLECRVPIIRGAVSSEGQAGLSIHRCRPCGVPHRPLLQLQWL